jgi:hypothetical protein
MLRPRCNMETPRGTGTEVDWHWLAAQVELSVGMGGNEWLLVIFLKNEMQRGGKNAAISWAGDLVRK